MAANTAQCVSGLFDPELALIDSYNCICNPGFTGVNCEVSERASPKAGHILTNWLVCYDPVHLSWRT